MPNRIFVGSLLLLALLAAAGPGFSGHWINLQNPNRELQITETSAGLELDNQFHPLDQAQEGPQPGSSNFLFSKLTHDLAGYHLYCESRQTTRGPDGAILILFYEVHTDYQLLPSGHLLVKETCGSRRDGFRNLESEYVRQGESS